MNAAVIISLRLIHSPTQHNIIKRNADDKNATKILGFRVEKTEKEPEVEDGVPVIRSDTKVVLRLFGTGFTERTIIGMTSEKMEFGKACNMMISTGFFKISVESPINALVEILLPKNTVELYFCTSNENDVSCYVQNVSYG